jgi:molecular chaperone GrpE
LKLLPVLDTLVLAQKHLNDKGLELSIQQFLDVIEKEGVKQIETKDKEFNPHMMEVIEIVDGEDGKVLEEIRAGYMLYDKVLRPAQVKVGKK